MSTGHGVLHGGASAAGDPRPAAPLLHQPRCPTDASAQELRHEEGRPGQVKLVFTSTGTEFNGPGSLDP